MSTGGEDSNKPSAEAPAIMETDDTKADESNQAAASVKDGDGKTGDDSKDGEKKTRKKESKKRVRRVGKTEPRKMPKEAAGNEEEVKAGSPPADVKAAAETIEVPVGEGGGSVTIRRVVSKHDEKWNSMFEKLLEYKKEHNNTLVPQCYKVDLKLGRWVHYQRVEYWIYQQSGTGKITPDRISRLDAMGFEWDPQKAQWNVMFDKLQKFKEESGHCKVPKGYAKDKELANWVRNQRLERANMNKGKKSRMTLERYEKLDSLGFKWSTTIVKKGGSPAKKATGKDDGAAAATVKDDKKKDEAEKDDVKAAAETGADAEVVQGVEV